MYGFSISLRNRDTNTNNIYVGIHADTNEAVIAADKLYPTPPHDLGNGPIRYPLRPANITRAGITFTALATIGAGCLMYVNSATGETFCKKCKVDGENNGVLRVLIYKDEHLVEFVKPMPPVEEVIESVVVASEKPKKAKKARKQKQAA